MRNKQNRILLSCVKILLGSFNINKRERVTARRESNDIGRLSNNIVYNIYVVYWLCHVYCLNSINLPLSTNPNNIEREREGERLL